MRRLARRSWSREASGRTCGASRCTTADTWLGFNVLGMKASSGGVGLGDQSLLYECRQGLLERQHAFAEAGDDRVPQLVRLAFLDQVPNCAVDDQHLVRRNEPAADF